MITLENIFQHEFIGLATQISDSTNRELIGLNGTITDETKSMFAISTKGKTKSIPKSNSIWRFKVENQIVTMDGSKIEKRPFDRLGGKA